MRFINRTCDICGNTLFNKYGNRNDIHIYRFKRVDYCVCISGKNMITRMDICDECLSKFSKFVKQENESYVEANKLYNSERS